MNHPHGSRERYEQSPDGCCDGCRLMMILHSKPSYAAATFERAIPDSRIPADGHAQLLLAFGRHGYSFDDLATLCDLSAGTLKHIAWGITRSIYPDTAHRIARLVDLLPSERQDEEAIA